MIPKRIYYEPDSLEYELGRQLQEKYKDIPWYEIKSHNNIEELRSRGNEDFVEMKRYLIIGIRKTHKYSANEKISDYLVPYTSSGCSAMCLYCYLVCNYNKCSYMRLYVNREAMLSRLIRYSYKTGQPAVFEIGSNSDLLLEHQFTGNLPVTIEQFGREGRGKLTFPTKFSMVEPLLSLDHQGKTIFRMSLNPQEVIDQVEFGTASLKQRLTAVNEMFQAGYPVGILIAPVILLEGWKRMYRELLDCMNDLLSEKLKQQLRLEVIFMTYSYVHRAINDQAFPDALKLYNQEMMTGRGRGRYCYRQEYREEAEQWIRAEIHRRFGYAEVVYVV